ncbi:hypothetical protein [Accumulibacter sp.]|uniref:Uncharacterized protein n=1 Tax=Accumulibacter regalis TaxID=522306 RepID=C7RQN4_ACCRE|nr:hypothetical protein [Accumulibacter sp.]MBN8497299.1 hypothetical protein [Accumulibacter sp.]MBO3714359.1 hypothetical protein [Accumulibacter sp.]
METYEEMYNRLKDDFTLVMDYTTYEPPTNHRFKVVVYDVRYYDNEDTRLIAEDFVDYFDEYNQNGKKAFENDEQAREHFLQKAHQAMGWNIADCRVLITIES